MAAKGIFCLVLLAAFLDLATPIPYHQGHSHQQGISQAHNTSSPPSPPDSSWSPPDLPSPPANAKGPPGHLSPPPNYWGPPNPPANYLGHPSPPTNSMSPPHHPSHLANYSLGPPGHPSHPAGYWGPPNPPTTSWGPPSHPANSWGPPSPPAGYWGPPSPPANAWGTKPFGLPSCKCTNPFLGTHNAYRGDANNLCGSSGPGFCYVDCTAGCSDVKFTASLTLMHIGCHSSLACRLNKDIVLQSHVLPGNNRDKCKYKCTRKGGCEVSYVGPPRRGKTLGSCFGASFGGGCRGTPKECRDCNTVISC